MEPPADLQVEMLRRMIRIRRFEETVDKLFKDGEIPGFIHLSIGQEAVAVGACIPLQEDDHIVGTHRGHGYCVAKGADLKKMMAELFGKRTGLHRGKAGSMHLSDFDKGMLASHGIVGAGIPMAVGAALGCKLRGLNRVVMCFFSDGACNTGAFHEGLNMAAIWDLPVVFVCDNNRWAVSTPVESVIKIKDISDRAHAYGIQGVTVDGNDVIAMYNVASEAIKRAREGKPTLIEAKTYRIAGHFVGDPEHIRSKEEIEKWKEKCPIKRLKLKLVGGKILTEEEIGKIEQEIGREIDDAVRFARESPFPEPEEALKDVYAEGMLNE